MAGGLDDGDELTEQHEINVTPEEADAFALRWLVVSLVVLAVGFGMRKASGADAAKA